MIIRRGKAKVKVNYTLATIYEHYAVANKPFLNYRGAPFLVDKKTFIAVNLRFYSMMMHDIIYNAATVKLPNRMGSLRIMKRYTNVNRLRARNKLKLDYGHYLKTGEKKYHLNEHRNYHYYRWNWSYGVIEGIKRYKITVMRHWKRLVAKELKTNPAIDYFS
jgi:hypothetical protein